MNEGVAPERECCEDPACANAVAAAATAEAARLSATERQLILGVLQRNEQLHKDQQHRIHRLQAELRVLRQRGAIRVDDPRRPDPDRSCARCRCELGRVIRRGATCRACRQRICKACRVYHLTGPEWVCTVCHKHMEIQAATGEWMNEFVRRPSRRRDNRVYNPSTDIVKRSIRRSWTISSPSTRWSFIRGNSTDFRPYNSLPRCNDINNYPSLVAHQQTSANSLEQTAKAILATSLEAVIPTKPADAKVSTLWRRHHSPAKRTQSEEVYETKPDDALLPTALSLLGGLINNNITNSNKHEEVKREPSPKPRVNPLIKYASERKASMPQHDQEHEDEQSSSDSECAEGPPAISMDLLKTSGGSPPKGKRKLQHAKSDSETATAIGGSGNRLVVKKPLETSKSEDCASTTQTVVLHEKRVSFSAEKVNEVVKDKDDTPAPQLELCDIEPISGTVFRKVTVRRRRQDMRKMHAVDAGWRGRGRGGNSTGGSSGEPPNEMLLPEGDDYKLVFISSDSSSKEEDPDDNDSSTTTSGSSFPVDECDWDYFEPGGGGTRPMLSWTTSPYGSPRVCRKSAVESPLGSPLVYRRGRVVRESGTDTGTDDDIVRFDTQSPSSSSSRDVEDPPPPATTLKDTKEEDEGTLQHVVPGACKNCGGGGGVGVTQYVPIPVPVPIPIPMPMPLHWDWEQMVVYTPEMLEALRNHLRVLPRALSAYLNQAAIAWPPINSGEQNAAAGSSGAAPDVRRVNSSVTPTVPTPADEVAEVQQPREGAHATMRIETCDSPAKAVRAVLIDSPSILECDKKMADSSSNSEEDEDDDEDNECNNTVVHNNKKVHSRVYNVNNEKSSSSSSASTSSASASSSGSSDEEDASDPKINKKKRRHSTRVYVVNETTSCSSDNDNTDVEDAVEGEYIILTNIRPLGDNPEEGVGDAVIPQTQEVKEGACDTFVKTVDDYDSPPSPPSVAQRSRSSAETTVTQEENAAATLVGPRAGSERAVNAALPPVVSDVAAASVAAPQQQRHANNARYTSLIMITQDGRTPPPPPVSVVTSDTTTLVADAEDIVVRHTNRQPPVDAAPSATPTITADDDADSDKDNKDSVQQEEEPSDSQSVTVITGGDTLSAVVCLEEGLADDDSWVEDLSHDDASSNNDSSSGEEVLHCTAAIDHEDELRGYHRTAIDFTLHTIVEESCEESEVEANTIKRQRPQSATDLEKYFFFGLADGSASLPREDTLSETSSICSESLDSYVGGADGTEPTSNDTANNDPGLDLASSRLEKYFLSGFTSFKAERRDSDGSVGSDSEGKPSPEQRRKRLVRARGTGRSHSSSLDNLIVSNPDLSMEPNEQLEEDSSSSDSDTYDESNFDKNDGQFDTVKRKKNKKRNGNGTSSPSDEVKLETTQEVNEDLPSEEEGQKTPSPPELPPFTSDFANRNKQQSRDSGFLGSNDDLNKDTTTEQPQSAHCSADTRNELRMNLYNISEEKRSEERLTDSTPPATSLTRKDSFNNWSSDEETNLMMCKMRQFFKTMVAANNSTSKPSTPVMGPKPMPSPRLNKTRCKPPQLVYFENELTRLMKTVPGIRDDQVREIVEYLSSEDTWSDSYDSSDYTSSDLDLEGNAVCGSKSVLQQQISDSCKQIINKFDASVDDEGDEGDGGILDETHNLTKETAFVYQKLVASFEKIATGDKGEEKTNSPPLIAKVMHHIGSRLVALMHEVSSGESHASNSPKQVSGGRYHRRIHQKISSSTTTTEDDDSTSDSNLNDKLSTLEDVTPYNLLPRSRSHDLLMSESRAHHQSSISDIAEEREISDCERFSWRGSFESALLATDSRNKLSLIGGEGSASASALAIAAKRRSAGDLLFSNKSLSREQLDRVRSCGSIGGASSEDKLWVAGRPSRRRSSVPDASCGSGGSADGEEDDDEDLENRSTLPRSLQSSTAATTNSLPRLPTNAAASSMQKAQSMYHFTNNSASVGSGGGGGNGVKSARYRPPGFINRGLLASGSGGVPKRAVSAPGLQPTPQRRGRRSQPSQTQQQQQQQQLLAVVQQNDDVSFSGETHPHSTSSPMLTARATKSATPSPVAAHNKSTRSLGEWHHQTHEDDIDHLVAIHSKRNSLSNLGTRSDSLASVYSGAGEGRYGSVAVKGQVEFGLQYNYKAGALEINVKQCRDLAAVDAKRNRSDPYVKVYLLPDKSKSGKRKTKVKKHTLNPIFDECLKFHMSLSGLETRTLWLTVWHSDMFGRNDFLGEVMMTLENKVFDDPTPKWYNLQERTEPFDDLSFKGDILVGLKFVPPDMTVHKKGKRSRGSLHVLVKEAKSLTAVKANGTSDPFCKSYLLPDKGRHSKQKTSVIRRTMNPVWNHTFIYEDVTLQELAERCLELTIWDHDRLASNEFIGSVRFSLGTGKTYGKAVDWMDASGKELSLWKSMLERPNFWVEGCVSLRPTLEHRTS